MLQSSFSPMLLFGEKRRMTLTVVPAVVVVVVCVMVSE